MLEDALHRLVIHAPPGHCRGGAIFGIDLLERRRLALARAVSWSA
jgi:hypothetical protein